MRIFYQLLSLLFSITTIKGLHTNIHNNVIKQKLSSLITFVYSVAKADNFLHFSSSFIRTFCHFHAYQTVVHVLLIIEKSLLQKSRTTTKVSYLPFLTVSRPLCIHEDRIIVVNNSIWSDLRLPATDYNYVLLFLCVTRLLYKIELGTILLVTQGNLLRKI